ncbi:hypothetical protein NDU88_003210, partial [Pleurodeles waltl]
ERSCRGKLCPLMPRKAVQSELLSHVAIHRSNPRNFPASIGFAGEAQLESQVTAN